MPEFKSALLVAARADEAAPVVARLRSAGFRDVAVLPTADAVGVLASRRFEIVGVFESVATGLDADQRRVFRDAGAVLLSAFDAAGLSQFARAADVRTFPDGLLETDAGEASAENDLLRGAAHALSNRVQAAMGWASLLEYQGVSPEARKESIVRVRGELSLLGRFAQGLAALAGRGAGRSTPETVDLAAVLSAEAAARGATVRIEGAPPSAFVDADELALAAALILADVDEDAAPEVRLSIRGSKARAAFPFSSPEALPTRDETPASVMRRVKKTSALGAALLMRLAARFGGSIESTVDQDGGPRLVLSLPSANAAGRAAEEGLS
jgi:hypothetical protein